MRDIKFRLFNKERNVMMIGINQYGFDEPDNNIKTSSAGAFTRLWESIARINEDDNFELMQFTGLTDKNGVDIYEGDIVIHDGEVLDVEYDDFIYRNMIGGECDTWGEHVSADECEIIGNIHMNPELLDKEETK